MDPMGYARVVFRQPDGATAQQCAQLSDVRWIRGWDHVAEYEGGGTGIIMTSEEALRIFGLLRLYEAVERGSAAFFGSAAALNTAIKRVMSSDREMELLARSADIDMAELSGAMAGQKRLTMVQVERVALLVGGIDLKSFGT